MESNLEKGNSFIENSPIKEAYNLLQAHSPLELSKKYTEEDQRLMKSKSWDYSNPDLLTNKVKEILEKVPAEYLSNEEKEWRNEILWFWYHHAISCALGRYHDLEKAKYFASEALCHQSEDHPNQITKLFDLLVNDKLQEAEEFSQNIVNDKDTAEYLISAYKDNWKNF